MSILRLLALVCACPEASEIEDIPAVSCIERFGQIQKLILQRTKSGSTVNEIVIATTDPKLLATWTALLAASDETKVQVTPTIAAPNNEAGEARTYGGGNTTPSGVEIILGSNPSPFTAEFLDTPQNVIAAIKKYRCETGLSIMLVNERGQIGCWADDTVTPTKIKGFPAQSFFVGDKIMGNFEEPDKNPLSWNFLPDWSDNFHILTPTDFSALDLS